MPTITATRFINSVRHFEVDGAIREGVVEDATWDAWGAERRVWLLDGRLHRTDGPAVIEVGTPFREWYRWGLHHRDDGPALIDRIGGRLFFLGGWMEFWTLPEALWSARELRNRLRRAIEPASERGAARATEQQRRKALRLLSRPRAPISTQVLQATVTEAITSPTPELRRWGQSLMPVLARRLSAGR